MANEILRARFESKFLVDSLHRVLVEVDPLMGCRVVISPSLEEGKEVSCPPLFKEAHQGRFERLCFIRGYLGDSAIPIDERASDLLELKVTGDIGVDEDFGKFTGGNDELGDQVDCVVAVATELCWRLSRSLEVTVKLSKGWS